MIKHSVIVVTYNQKPYIRRALDSIFNQSVIPYEVIIADDCSTDGTSEIVMEYKIKYPDIVKVIRNEKNLGLYENHNSAFKHTTGDIISILAGDDFYRPGRFEAFNNIIAESNLDPNKERFSLITHSAHYSPDGTFKINKIYPFKKKNALRNIVRRTFPSIGIGYSRMLFSEMPPCDEHIGICADWIWDFEQSLLCDQYYFIDEVTYVYRVGVGVSSRCDIRVLLRSCLAVFEKVEKDYGNRLSLRDKLYLKLDKYQNIYFYDRTVKNYMYFMMFFVLNVPFLPSRKFIEFRKVLFPNRLSLLHKFKKLIRLLVCKRGPNEM